MEDWKREKFLNFRLYAVTNLKNADSGEIEKIDRAYAGGADIVQLRSRSLSDADLYKLGLEIRRLADRYRGLYFVNDRLDLALATEADGLHLGQEDLPVAAVREMGSRQGTSFLIGKSTHSLDQAMSAAAEGVDYIGVGPVFSTPTKPDYAPVGLQLVSQVKKSVRIPFVAIGGIQPDNLESVLQHGASRVAVVRALFESENIYESTRKLRDRIERHVTEPLQRS